MHTNIFFPKLCLPLQSCRFEVVISDFVGLHGTTAFCKLAVNLPVSDNDVSGMKIIDMRSAPNSIQQKAITQPPRHGKPPLVVMFDAEVSQENHAIAIQACNSHTFMDLKMSHITMYEMQRGVKDILSLLTCLEVST